ncbi:MAG: hypothetical protein H6842_05300 [Rhodospirillaceae bacterium]|nr:hypothetical protein [Rhodospirillaceae bacterium]
MARLGIIVSSILLLAGSPAWASEVVLYDAPGCAGPYRVLVDSEADLDRVDFGNAAASVRVVAGTWTFFRDDGFQSNNGPPVTLGPGDCVTLGAGPAAQFPPELMDSVQLTTPAPGPGSVIVLYDGPGLAPPYRVLTGNTPDLDQVAFDNRIGSFQVVSGLWRIFRDDGFQAASGPPVEAGTGVYGDIAALGLPADAASSVMRLTVASNPPLPPARDPVAVACPPGSAGNGAACVDCGRLGQQVSANGGACECPPGQRTVGGRIVGGIPVGVCQRQLAVPTAPQAPPADCAGNEVMVGSLEVGGGCLPCPEFAEPNETHTACRCRDGFLQVGIGSTYGFPVCSPASGGTGAGPGPGPAVPAMVEHVVSGWDAYQVASNRRFTFASIGFIPILGECNIAIPGYGDRFTVEYLPIPGGGSCRNMLFADRLLRAPWEFVSWTVRPILEAAAACGAFQISEIRVNPNQPRDMSHQVTIALPPPALVPLVCTIEVTTITLRGPAGADPLDAFR